METPDNISCSKKQIINNYLFKTIFYRNYFDFQKIPELERTTLARININF